MSDEKKEFPHQPMYDRLVVKRVPEAEVAKGGIIIPTQAQTKQAIGTVIAIGHGRLTPEGQLIPLKVKVDEVVLFDQYGGEDIKIDGVEYLIIKEACIQIIKRTPLVVEKIEPNVFEQSEALPMVGYCKRCKHKVTEPEWKSLHSSHEVDPVE